MSEITTGAVNHMALTVTDLERARDFYVQVLGFQFVTEFGPKYLLSNGELILALNLAPDPGQAISGDRFSENRVGLDHVSFNVGSLAALESARERLDELNVPHGEIKDLGDLGIKVLAFRDPDNIQLELTAAKA
ncbi:MAG: VOC family protein [Candidatus Promineifilaceae bacterium]|nr:VOC family protein [Candidatus Promineifilaceae bacterium]